jgi:hypothetical protein
MACLFMDDVLKVKEEPLLRHSIFGIRDRKGWGPEGGFSVLAEYL